MTPEYQSDTLSRPRRFRSYEPAPILQQDTGSYRLIKVISRSDAAWLDEPAYDPDAWLKEVLFFNTFDSFAWQPNLFNYLDTFGSLYQAASELVAWSQDAVQSRRAHLITKRHTQGLTTVEQTELSQLQESESVRLSAEMQSSLDYLRSLQRQP